MKVLLLKDVFNLGRAGEIKKVANGFGRNFLIPQNLAMLATPGALKQVDRISAQADKRRNLLNEELASVAEQLAEVQLQFSAKAGETGKLYGSITTQAIAKELSDDLNMELSKRQIDSQPLRLLGLHKLKVRLTIDLIPEISIVVYREGEPPENYMIPAEELAKHAEVLVAEADDLLDDDQDADEADEIEEQAEEPSADNTQEDTEDQAVETEPENEN